MRITKGRAFDTHMGGCNFCVRHIHPGGETDHNVTKIESENPWGNPTVSVRFCDPCLDELDLRSTHDPTGEKR